ncbi:uncharacterized protein BDW47DRAFT_88419 [Aspergillus candidus]|uniref:Uncharacterized protein n=1 Tax=Aspergillus candidus TaxID=41067 RepID=A0A2I2FIP3_ASPCN|nr:hypothetical protein BDW47DRAFT_88419 [Aspergillus candidus]PLB40496.1 hypothetical protein BDW47DRAFT_88419 [Aspergillus candidus]
MSENWGLIWDKTPKLERLFEWSPLQRVYEVFANQGPDIQVGRIGGKSASASRTRRAGGDESTKKKSTPSRDGRRDATRSRYRGPINSRVLGLPEERSDRLKRRDDGPDVGSWSGAEDCDGTGGEGDIKEEHGEENGEEHDKEGEEEEEEERGWFGFLWSTPSSGARDERQVVPERDEDRHGREYPAVCYHDAADENAGTALVRAVPGGWFGFLGWSLSRSTRDVRQVV